MADEKGFLIQVLSDHLKERETATVENIEWSIVIRLSRIHQVEGILFYQCKSFVPPDEYEQLEQKYYSTIYYYKNRERLLAKIESVFSSNGISYIEIKGFKAARYYPVPGLRTMGDTDLVVHEEDREKASRILTEIGLINKYEFTGKERGFTANNINIELHHHFIYDEIITISEHDLFFNDCWKYVEQGELNHSFHFLFLVAHLRKHMLNEGVGIRQFMDLAVAIKNDPTLDWKWIVDKLNTLHLLKFANVCFGMIDYWFGIKAPVEFGEIDTEFKEQATASILKNGVFGFDDRKNRGNHTLNQMRSYNGPRWLFRTKMILEHTFPSYDFLKIDESYRFLNGKQWLLPVAWLYRFYLMLIGKRTSAGVIFERIMQSNEVIEERNQELRQWGLID